MSEIPDYTPNYLPDARYLSKGDIIDESQGNY